MQKPEDTSNFHHPQPLQGLLSDSVSRRFRELRTEMKLELEADTAYFRKHPERTCRVRFPFDREEDFLRLLEIITGDESFPSEEEEMVVIVARTENGIYLRKPIANLGHSFTDEILENMSQDSEALLMTFIYPIQGEGPQ